MHEPGTDGEDEVLAAVHLPADPIAPPGIDAGVAVHVVGVGPAPSGDEVVLALERRPAGIGVPHRPPQEAHDLFVAAQTQVRSQLKPLPATAMRLWTDGVAVLATKFKSRLRTVAAWIKERHAGVSGDLGAQNLRLERLVTQSYPNRR